MPGKATIPSRPGSLERFEVLTLTTPLDVAAGQAPRLAHDVNARLVLGKALPTSPNELMISLTMAVGGGAAPQNLRGQVLGWVGEVREIVNALPGRAIPLPSATPR